MKFSLAQSLVGNLNSIKNAMKAQQWHDAMRMAHSLKGTLAIVGAEDLREIATLLEYSCRDEKAEEAEKNLAILEQTKEQLIEALNKI
ncbi:Hpt domain-containing protein [Desulfovibrio litoralis]